MFSSSDGIHQHATCLALVMVCYVEYCRGGTFYFKYLMEFSDDRAFDLAL